MKTEQLFIENTPAVLYGEPSDTLWLFIHGQFGCKEEALPFAEIVSPDAQVLSIDLPNHAHAKTGMRNLHHGQPHPNSPA
ncbi:hypothetical protein DWV55_06420 [Butyricicoccus sp. AF10-3]|nr:hypothetical protein [Butyricicoccus sp. AF10-3]RHS36855.1 hypothetical protein DWV55_06420 [Butyricicoccus sp. AF10-3]